MTHLGQFAINISGVGMDLRIKPKTVPISLVPGACPGSVAIRGITCYIERLEYFRKTDKPQDKTTGRQDVTSYVHPDNEG